MYGAPCGGRAWGQTCGNRLVRRAEARGNAEGKVGGQGRDRTADTAIFSRMLYQLSYLATACAYERAQKSNYNTGKTPEKSGVGP